MSDAPPRTLADCLAATLRWLALAIDARRAFGLGVPLIGLIVARFQRINQLFRRVSEGRFVPRPHAAGSPRPGRSAPAQRLPRHFGWLLPLVPDANAARAQLEHLFRQPEMAALLQTAPGPTARALRPLCRMLGVTPPPAIAPPERPRKPRKSRKPRQTPPQPPPEQNLPDWLRDRRKPWSLARIRGSPGRP